MVKGLISLNLASVIRAARFGLRDSVGHLSDCYFAADPFGYRGTIPQVELRDVAGDRRLIRIDGAYSYVDGSLPWNDLVALLAILVNRAPRSVLEIGTFNGHTTRLMALNLPGATVHTVDLPEEYAPRSGPSPLPKDDFHLIAGRSVGREYRDDPSVTNVVQHFGDTATWDFAQAEGATFFFIDGSHTYAYARNDTEKSLLACRGRRATLVWHDCDATHRGVVRWLEEMAAAGKPVQHVRGTKLAVMDVEA